MTGNVFNPKGDNLHILLPGPRVLWLSFTPNNKFQCFIFIRPRLYVLNAIRVSVLFPLSLSGSTRAAKRLLLRTRAATAITTAAIAATAIAAARSAVAFASRAPMFFAALRFSMASSVPRDSSSVRQTVLFASRAVTFSRSINTVAVFTPPPQAQHTTLEEKKTQSCSPHRLGSSSYASQSLFREPRYVR